MASRSSVFLSLFIALAFLPHSQVTAAADPVELSLSSPFSSALEALQKQINYSFENVGMLRLAMTHSSYSIESNKALSILGANVIDTAVSMQSLRTDIDISSTTLSERVAQISNVDNSCAVDGMRLGIHKVVRVSSKTDSTTPSVVCGAFRAIFGAVALDSGKADDAGKVFLNVHRGGVGGGEVGRAHIVLEASS
ncbi:Protein NUCLEAR FUSION DEFECTIVE 2 [Linum perenne]